MLYLVCISLPGLGLWPWAVACQGSFSAVSQAGAPFACVSSFISVDSVNYLRACLFSGSLKLYSYFPFSWCSSILSWLLAWSTVILRACWVFVMFGIGRLFKCKESCYQADNVNLIPRTHIVKLGNRLPQTVFWEMAPIPNTHIRKILKINVTLVSLICLSFWIEVRFNSHYASHCKAHNSVTL